MSTLIGRLINLPALNSLATIIVFLVALGLVFVLFTAPNTAASLRSVARLAWTGLCTPFEFIRNSFAVMNASLSAEKDYAGTREFVLFRYSRIQYLIACVLSVIFLAAALTRALLVLYPSGEIQQYGQLKSELARLNEDLTATQKNIADASRPDYTRKMVAERDKWQRIYNQQQESDANFRPKITFNSSVLVQIDGASDSNTLTQIGGNLDTFFLYCPGPNWTGFGVDECNLFKSQLAELIQRKLRELQFLQNINSANLAIQNNGATVASFREHYAQVNGQVASTRDQLKASDPWSAKTLGRHIAAMLLVLVGAVSLFIMTIWIYAMFIDVFNWLVMMMRSLEKRHSEEG